MAIRIDKSIVRGELSNEVRGLVTGLIWVVGRTDPLRLRLTGDCLRDLAGCSVKFENPDPVAEPTAEVISGEQVGNVGDMTASRRLKLPTVTEEELHELVRMRQEVPSVLANTLYLEWFSEKNGRVVIESCGCRTKVSEPAWNMTEEEERSQEAESQRSFYNFLDKITGESGSHPPLDDDYTFSASNEEDDGDDFLFPDDIELAGDSSDEEAVDIEEELPFEANMEPLDEFEWERELREADRKAAAYQEALEKYRNSPERDRLVAEAMGWEDGDEADLDFDWKQMDFGSTSDGDSPLFDEPGDDAPEEFIELHHPLSRRVTELALQLQDDAEKRGLVVKHDPESPAHLNPYLSVVMHIIVLGGKLASALDGTVHGIDPEPGFVIAMLKRAQIPLNEALHAIGSLFSGHLDTNTAQWLEGARSELFDLRNEILELMRELRLKKK
jgi:hypothetical protein